MLIGRGKEDCHTWVVTKAIEVCRVRTPNCSYSNDDIAKWLARCGHDSGKRGRRKAVAHERGFVLFPYVG